MAHLDAASDRIGDRAKARFDDMVEAVRAGFAFAHKENASAYQRWRMRRQQGDHAERSPGLTGAALEQAVMAIAARDPGLVAVRM